MRVRALTVFIDQLHSFEDVESVVREAASIAKSLEDEMKGYGYEVQTTRLVCPPLEQWAPLPSNAHGIRRGPSATIAFFKKLSVVLEELGVQFFNIGPALTAEGRSFIVPILKLSDVYNASMDCTPELEGETATTAMAEAAQAMITLSQQTEGGSGNFRFCASFSCTQGIPFFPAAFAKSPVAETPAPAIGLTSTFGSFGRRPPSTDQAPPRFRFAMGLECGDVALKALKKAAGIVDTEVVEEPTTEATPAEAEPGDTGAENPEEEKPEEEKPVEEEEEEKVEEKILYVTKKEEPEEPEKEEEPKKEEGGGGGGFGFGLPFGGGGGDDKKPEENSEVVEEKKEEGGGGGGFGFGLPFGGGGGGDKPEEEGGNEESKKEGGVGFGFGMPFGKKKTEEIEAEEKAKELEDLKARVAELEEIESAKKEVDAKAEELERKLASLETESAAVSAALRARVEELEVQFVRPNANYTIGTRLSTDAVRDALTEAFEAALTPLDKKGMIVGARLGVVYGGIDVSLNPGLAAEDSVGAAVEVALGGRPFGSTGTMAVAATITASLQDLPVKLTGYSGLMLPPLEDATLAARASESPASYGIPELLSYSSVCGVGLDTVPIPGDTTPEEISVLLSDVAALSLKWNKRLSCRLFPVPGLQAGEMTKFDNEHLVNCRVFKV